MPTILWIVIIAVVAVVCFLLGVMYRKKVAEREIFSAEEEAKRIINESIKSAESKKREALVEAKEEIHKSRSEYERGGKERRSELSKQERRLQQKEENLDKKIDAIEKKSETLNSKIAAADAQQQEIALIKKSQLEMLEKISGFSVEEAKAYLIANIRDEVTHEMAMKVKEIEASEYSLKDVITIASLIEKETTGKDREKISSVIYNRLETSGETYYLLQIDASLVDAAGRPITQGDYKELKSPYNLYLHEGLPPTPIANPGLASIQAAVEPADTDYFFYVLGSDGAHIFSKTLAEHNKAIASVG